MQETRWDNTEVLTDAVSQQQVATAAQALAAEPGPTPGKRNRVVALHPIGSVVTLADGTEYKVGQHGNWERISGKNTGGRKSRSAGRNRRR